MRQGGHLKVLLTARDLAASRAISTLKDNMGMEVSVLAAYKEDRYSSWVHRASKVYFLESFKHYWNIERLIAICLKQKVDVVYAGWGPVAEDPGFALACRRVMPRLFLIAPDVEVLKVSGDKPRTRELVRQAGVPRLCGTGELPRELPEARRQAHMIGFPDRPVLFKGTNTGGGADIRCVTTWEEFETTFLTKRPIARSSTGIGLFLEQYLPEAYHIEVQVAGDKYGNVMVLDVRDCSLQDGYAKRVEESPPDPRKLSAELMEKIREYALQIAQYLARTYGFICVITIEFLVTPEGKIYFIEINARLQVEHGVTEERIGLDLVKLQFDLAMGEPLSTIIQGDLKNKADAVMEARIYVPGRYGDKLVRGFEYFPFGDDVRIDTYLPGYLSPHFVGHVANVIVSANGEDARERARTRLLNVLRELDLIGVGTNRYEQMALLDHVDFIGGYHTTTLIGKYREEGILEQRIQELDSQDRERRRYFGPTEVADPSWIFDLKRG